LKIPDVTGALACFVCRFYITGLTIFVSLSYLPAWLFATMPRFLAGAAEATPTVKKGIRVVSSAKVLSAAEKATIEGMHCGCPDQKPGYGFGTTGHYGPPGQGFEDHDSWRMHVGTDGQTPTGRALPPRAFTTPTR
jgi:hypothetical protein